MLFKSAGTVLIFQLICYWEGSVKISISEMKLFPVLFCFVLYLELWYWVQKHLEVWCRLKQVTLFSLKNAPFGCLATLVILKSALFWYAEPHQLSCTYYFYSFTPNLLVHMFKVCYWQTRRHRERTDGFQREGRWVLGERARGIKKDKSVATKQSWEVQLRE